MKFYRLFIFLITCLILTSCGLLGGEDEEKLKELLPPENELIPLEVGNYWVHDQWYLDTSLKDTVRKEVLSVQNIIADKTRIRAFGTYRFYYKDRPREDALVSLEANGPAGLYFLGFKIPTDSLYNLNQGLYYKYPATVGDSWKKTTVLYDSRNEEMTLGSTRIIELIDTTRTIETPAGVFENCYVYKHNDFRGTSPETHYFYIKPGIGIVGVDTGIDGGNEVGEDTTGQKRLIEYQIKDF
ncbi:MAG: hypothetical protein WD059_14320 [Balneolaceae bacterium]